MSSVINAPEAPSTSNAQPVNRPKHAWKRFSYVQLVVMGLATVPAIVIVMAIGAGLLGIASGEEVVEVSLGAGEDPGVVVFALMFLASPVQWFTGRSQIRVRKYLGIVFYLLAFSNGAMFVYEEGYVAAFGAPFLVAGTIALLLSTPLFLTSGRWAQRRLGMRRWRLLHRLTYVIAVALIVHLVLGGGGIEALVIMLGFVARVPSVRRRLTRTTVKS